MHICTYNEITVLCLHYSATNQLSGIDAWQVKTEVSVLRFSYKWYCLIRMSRDNRLRRGSVSAGTLVMGSTPSSGLCLRPRHPAMLKSHNPVSAHVPLTWFMTKIYVIGAIIHPNKSTNWSANLIVPAAGQSNVISRSPVGRKFRQLTAMMCFSLLWFTCFSIFWAGALG